MIDWLLDLPVRFNKLHVMLQWLHTSAQWYGALIDWLKGLFIYLSIYLFIDVFIYLYSYLFVYLFLRYGITNYTRYYNDYIRLYNDTVRDVVLREDPVSRPFVMSSPSNGRETETEGWVAKDPQSTRYGDSWSFLYCEFLLGSYLKFRILHNIYLVYFVWLTWILIF